ncbi:MAG: hypothetical protein V3R86_05250 [Candidatus Hydrothermarchaeaceae archaeon]
MGKELPEEIKKILKQVNRRLINAESSVRVIEQRIDVVEGTVKAIERKIGSISKDLSELSGNNEDVERLREEVIRMSADAEGLATKGDVAALKKYLELVTVRRKGKRGKQ